MSSKFTIISLRIDMCPQFSNIVHHHFIAGDSSFIECTLSFNRMKKRLQSKHNVIGDCDIAFLSTKSGDEDILDANVWNRNRCFK